jgi:hypothetical protein
MVCAFCVVVETPILGQAIGTPLLPHLGKVAGAGFFGSVVLSLLLTPLCYYGMSVRVDADGIRSYNAWGLPAFLEWRQMVRVRPCRLLNLRYLRLDRLGTRPVLWLPIFLKDPAAFERAVREFVGENNALTIYFDSSPAAADSATAP